MFVIRSDEDVQLVELTAPQTGLGQHALDGKFDETPRIPLEDLAGGHDFLPSRVATIALIFLLFPLLTRQSDLFGIDDDDVIAEVFVGCKLWLVLAAQYGHDSGSQSTEHHTFRIDDVPLRGHLSLVEKPCFIAALFHFPEDLILHTSGTHKKWCAKVQRLLVTDNTRKEIFSTSPFQRLVNQG